MSDSIFIETSRLIIKTMELTDYSALGLQQKDPFFMEFFGGPREDLKIKEVLDLLYNHLKQYEFSQGLVFIKETKECIGRAGLVHLDFKSVPDLEVAYFLLEPYTRKGYATELGEALLAYAFNILKAPRVFATVDPKNVASCRVSEKLKMQFDREDIYETLNKSVRYYVKNRP